MTDGKTKYPVLEKVQYIAWLNDGVRIFSPSFTVNMATKMGLEINQLLAENERYKAALEDIVKQLNSRSVLAATEFAEHRDYFQDGLSAGLNEARILIEQALKGESGVK